MQILSYGNANYWITFIDHHSRYSKIFLLKDKTAEEVLSAIREFKLWATNQTGKNLKIIRTDQGLEYMNKKVQEYLQNEGIEHQRSCVYTPQQNGVRERLNRSISDTIQTLSNESKLPMAMWGELAQTSTYLLNRILKKGKEKTPHQIFKKRKFPVSLQHLRIIGSTCYVKEERQRQKLDPKSYTGFLVGNSENVKGYRIWKKENNLIIISKNVIIDEKLNHSDTISQHNVETNSVEGNNQQEYQAEAILGEHESEEGGKEILIQWKNYGPEYNSWEPETNVEHLNVYQQYKIKPYEVASVYHVTNDIPKNEKELQESTEFNQWFQAMMEEQMSSDAHGCYKLIDRTSDKRTIRGKWVFTKKRGIDPQHPLFKARYVLKGFEQRQGIDFSDIYSPTLGKDGLRYQFSVTVQRGMYLRQFDIKTAFLHSPIDTELLIEIPTFTNSKEKRTKYIGRLKKSLYGLKQAPMLWNKHITDVLKSANFENTPTEPCLFFKWLKKKYLCMLGAYVDNMIVSTDRKEDITIIIELLKTHFDLKDLGSPQEILGVRINHQREENILTMDQTNYIRSIIERYGYQKIKQRMVPITTNVKYKNEPNKESIQKEKYQQIIGSIMYISVTTRPYITYATCIAARYTEHAQNEHWSLLEQIIGFLARTIDLKLVFKQTNEEYRMFTDADFGSTEGRYSTSGSVLFHKTNLIGWSTKKQKRLAKSTVEAEYLAASQSSATLVGFMKLVYAIFGDSNQVQIPKVFVDSTGAISILKSGIPSNSTKHFKIDFL